MGLNILPRTHTEHTAVCRYKGFCHYKCMALQQQCLKKHRAAVQLLIATMGPACLPRERNTQRKKNQRSGERERENERGRMRERE